MSDDGKAGLRERLTLIAHVMPTWTAEVVIAVPVNRAMDEVAAWLRDRDADLWAAVDGAIMAHACVPLSNGEPMMVGCSCGGWVEEWNFSPESPDGMANYRQHRAAAILAALADTLDQATPATTEREGAGDGD